MINTTEAVSLPGPPSISIALQGGQAVITYTGILQSAPSPAGEYQDVPRATNPYTVPLGQAMFFRSGW